jgi:HSP20 family protein
MSFEFISYKIKKLKTNTMTLVKFNRRPFDRSFNNLVDDFFSDLPVFKGDDIKRELKGLVPVNITENEKSYNIEVVAPGFEKADFKVTVDDQILTIAADKKSETTEENKKQIRKEYNYRSFKRSFTLDEKTDAAGIDAKYVNGVLTLNLPKKEEVKTPAQQISIQ